MTTGKPESNSSKKCKVPGWQHLLPTMFAFVIALQIAIPAEFLQPAEAQNPGVHLKPKKKYNNDNEFVPEQLTQPPDLPYLPPYSGSAPNKYNNILAFRKKTSGPGFTMTFHVKEPPDEVISWYKNAFKQNKWAPQKNGDSKKMASGSRKGAVATVTAMKSNMRGYLTQVYLIYKISGNVQ